MIDRDQIVRALSDRKAIADWVIVERSIERAVVAGTTRRHERVTRFAIVLHVDVPEGRGSTHLELGPLDGEAGEVLDQAVALASTAVGDTWSSVPQAAPAKVVVIDPALAKADLVDHAVAIARALPPAATAAMIELTRTAHHVEAHSGLRTEWTSSHLRGTSVVATADRSLEIAREARRLVDLDLGAAIAAASADLVLYAKATAPKPGRCTLVISADALLHDGGYGMWSVFASQADAVLERQGLARYRVGKPVATGADAAIEPLYISSNGSLAFGVRTAPVGDDGDAVRQFTIIEGGICVGLGLTPREAAFRRRDPNGGIRNLVVGKGTWNGERPTGRVVEIRRLRNVSIDRYTGDASIEIALGLDGDAPFTGGTIRIDLIAALATARRSGNPIQRGPYVGPDAVMIADVDLVV